MRADLITIQQTLTPEAATVLNQSIAEATRRNHGHTTPLHVAATLLSSSSGFLRQACIKSHPNSSHPLQCRALELCFSRVFSLERLPTTTTSAASSPSQTQEPLLSNALTAALKRAQAHQRRGCPEQQQQPLLAVKVELEQSLFGHSANSRQAGIVNPSSIGLGYRSVPAPVNRNPYLNPRLQQNDKAQMAARFGEISGLVETWIGNSELNGGVVLDLGDLKWLAEYPAANGGGAGAEMRKLLERYKGRLCFIGTATCETYLR